MRAKAECELDISSEQYVALRNALIAIQSDASAVLSVLAAQSDNGARFVTAAYAELRRAMSDGRLSDAEVVGGLISSVLSAQEREASKKGAETHTHTESLRWLLEGVGAILARDNVTGVTYLANLTGVATANDSMQWIAWLWTARAARDAGSLKQATEAANKACSLSQELDAFARSVSASCLGEVRLLQGRLNEAAAQYRQATAGYEEFGYRRGIASAWLGQARVELARGRLKAANESAERARDLDENWEAPGVFLARLALAEDRPDRAAQVLQQLAALDPCPAPVERMVRLVRRVTNGEMTARLLVKYLELSERSPGRAVNNEIRQLAAKNPEFLELWELLAWNLAKLGEDDSAAEQFEQLSGKRLDGQLQSSVLLGLGCLANRRNLHRQSGARVRAAASSQLQTVTKAAGPEVDADDLDDAMLISQGQADGGMESLNVNDLVDQLSGTGEFDRLLLPSTNEVSSVPPPLPGDVTQKPKPVFTGDLQLLSVPDLLEFLKSSRRTGTLVVTSEHGIGAMHLRQGLLTGAAAPACDNLGSMLVDKGLVTRSQLESAADHQRKEMPDQLLGSILVEQGVVEEGPVKSAIVEQIHLAVIELVGWTSGRFAFEPEKSGDTAEGSIEVELDTQGVLLEVLRRIDEGNRD